MEDRDRHAQDADGTASFVAIGTELLVLDILIGMTAGMSTLTLRDAQHQDVFEVG